jgi:hypothetical protein
MWKNYMAFIIFRNENITITVKKEIQSIFNKNLYAGRFYITDIHVYMYVCIYIYNSHYLRLDLMQ